MAGLSYRGAAKTITDALLALVNVALRERTHTAADVVALRAIDAYGDDGSQSFTPGAAVYLTDPGAVFTWNADSEDADNGTSVIKPDDAGDALGRWVKATQARKWDDGTAVSARAAGYLRNAIIYSGERRDEDFEARIYGQRPCVVVDFLGRGKKPQSVTPGALAWATYHFQIDAVSFCARPEEKGFAGSPLPDEAVADPGAWAIAEDVEYLLAGCTGEEMGLSGVSHVTIGNMDIIERDLNGRRAVVSMDVEVYATLGHVDGDSVALTAVDVQPKLALTRPPGATLDADNVIVSGLTVSLGLGLSRAPANGSAYIGGAVVTVTGAPLHTFGADSDTYRDLKADGTFTYVEVPTGTPEPSTTAGALRIGVTRTSSSGVVSDTLLASTFRSIGPSIPLPP